MSNLRIALVLLCLPLPAMAGPHPLPDPLPLFATCTGRLSALMEFRWLMQDSAADLTERQRNTMANLLEAVLTPDQERRAMDLRLQAKVALAGLLQEAAFAHDRTRADWSRRRAMALVAECTSQVIS